MPSLADVLQTVEMDIKTEFLKHQSQLKQTINLVLDVFLQEAVRELGPMLFT